MASVSKSKAEVARWKRLLKLLETDKDLSRSKGGMTKRGLQTVCRQQELSDAGDRNDLVRRLFEKLKHPIDLFYEPGEFNIPTASRDRIPTITFTQSDAPHITITLRYKARLGSRGDVHLYEDAGAPRLYAVKVEQADGRGYYASEHSIIPDLRKADCGQIRARIIKTVKTPDGRGRLYYSLLEKMDGDLAHKATAAAGRFPAVERFREANGLASYVDAAVMIVDEVRRQVNCLLHIDPDYMYADLKPANVLFAQTGGKLVIKVGDLGSMIPQNGVYAMSYPCLPGGTAHQAFADGGSGTQDRRACLAFQLGVLLAELLSIDVTEYHYQRTAPRKSTLPLQADLHRRLSEKSRYLALLVDAVPEERPSIAVSFVRSPTAREATAVAEQARAFAQFNRDGDDLERRFPAARSSLVRALLAKNSATAIGDLLQRVDGMAAQLRKEDDVKAFSHSTIFERLLQNEGDYASTRDELLALYHRDF